MRFRSSFGKLFKRIAFALYCMPYGDDEMFTRTVRRIGTENNLVNVIRYGEKHPEGSIYFIDMEESDSGFFCSYNNLLALLYFADCHDMTPVVRYHKNFRYAETEAVNGTLNPFEYYFLQPGGVSLRQLFDTKTVYKSRKVNTHLARDLNPVRNAYLYSEEYINEMARIAAKYIHLNGVTAQRIHEDIPSLLKGKRTIAVHVRGTDFKKNHDGHPVAISEKEYLRHAILSLDKGYEQVFLATDSKEAVRIFREGLGEKMVCYPDVIRSDGLDSVMNSRSDRKLHHYLLGWEVLRDMHTMAACEGMIAGLSQVSKAARIQKRAAGNEYADLIILDKGINPRKKQRLRPTWSEPEAQRNRTGETA